MKRLINTKVSFLQVTLTIVFVTSLLVSNIITGKQLLLPLGITQAGALILFPVTYILSDVFSEVYGYRWSRVTCYFAFAMNLFMVLIFTITIKLPYPEYWANQGAFETVLGNTPRVLVASLCAYVVGDYANDRIFKKMKEKHPNEIKGFGWRAILSSLAGELVDSCIFMPVALYGQIPNQALVRMIFTGALLKTGYEAIILPVTYTVAKHVGRYEKTNA